MKTIRTAWSIFLMVAPAAVAVTLAAWMWWASEPLVYFVMILAGAA